jgi:hypothetical protein
MSSGITRKEQAANPLRQQENNLNDPLQIKEMIRVKGFAHLSTAISSEEFESISQQLGAILFRTELKITEGRKSVVYKPESIGFHMDNPTVQIIGWHCLRQDETDGASLLLDTADIAEHFLEPELKVLETINIRCPDLALHNPDAGKEAYFLSPLLSWNGSVPQVYFVGWLLLDSYDEQQTEVLEKFKDYLQQKQEHQVIRLRLKEGEALFINNRRLLHGRGPIEQNSSRLINRVWITG